ncbi:5-oxoprolinase subunit C family protein [Pseudotenacibaculum haliotis]|uniref:Biotin-dependent carboxyltransferase family protein n=1 Tax=Pseudotenacibaculum haliotis TaxID=1862138 RepID=A0ABW5LXP8_9FLAO
MIKVLHPGIYTSVQDQGRIGMAKKGIPQSGFMDAFSAELGNILLKNRKKEAVLEITYGLGKFEFTSDTFICLTGGNFSPKINTFPVEMNTVHEVKKGDFLSFGRRVYGARVYLAVQGGIQTDVVLKSRSFFPGITQQRLIKGEELKILKQNFYEAGYSRVKVYYEHFESPELECYPGPEYDQLNDKQKQQLQQAFTISEDNNRVGYRLNELIKNDLKPILTSAVLPGTVQLTPSGKLIVLMRDAQVTGGYPRVLQLSDYAVSKLSQKVAGDIVHFILSFQDQN